MRSETFCSKSASTKSMEHVPCAARFKLISTIHWPMLYWQVRSLLVRLFIWSCARERSLLRRNPPLKNWTGSPYLGRVCLSTGDASRSQLSRVAGGETLLTHEPDITILQPRLSWCDFARWRRISHQTILDGCSHIQGR